MIARCKGSKKNLENDNVESDFQQPLESNEHDNDELTSDEVISRALGLPVHDISNDGQNEIQRNEDCKDENNIIAFQTQEKSIGFSATDDDVVFGGYLVTDDDIHDLMHVLQQSDKKKWENKQLLILGNYWQVHISWISYWKKEISAIIEYFNVKLRRESTELMNTRNVSKNRPC